MRRFEDALRTTKDKREYHESLALGLDNCEIILKSLEEILQESLNRGDSTQTQIDSITDFVVGSYIITMK